MATDITLQQPRLPQTHMKETTAMNLEKGQKQVFHRIIHNTRMQASAFSLPLTQTGNYYAKSHSTGFSFLSGDDKGVILLDQGMAGDSKGHEVTPWQKLKADL